VLSRRLRWTLAVSFVALLGGAPAAGAEVDFAREDIAE
jgi:hypothetical protein